jgi:hypothetical protein
MTRLRALLIVTVASLVMGATACGDSDNAARPGSSPTTAPSGTQGPGSTTDVGGSGPGPTPAPPPSFAPGETGVTGVVGHNPCPTGDLRGCDARPEPLAATVIFTDRVSGSEVARARSAANGRYAIRIGAGDYRVVARPVASGLSCAEIDVAVATGHYVEADIDCQ